jgi:neutral trehalase
LRACGNWHWLREITAAELEWYSDLKEELRKSEIPVEDLSELGRIVKGVREFGYDVKKVLGEFSNLKSLRIQYKNYREEISILKYQHYILTQECSSLQETANSWHQTLSMCGELYDMGFRFKELKFFGTLLRRSQ